MSVKGYFGGNGAVPTAQLIGTNQVMSAEGTILRDNGFKNYIREPSENGFTGWATSNASLITIGTTTTAANLPAASCGSALVFTGVSGLAGYVRYRWTLDQVDYNTLLNIVWGQLYAGAAGGYVVEVWSNTLANYSGTSTQITVMSPNVPTFNGTWNTTFLSSGSTAPYLELRIRVNSTTTPLYLANVIVTPGQLVQGAAVSGPVIFTPSLAAGFGTITVREAYYYRIGNRMIGSITIKAGTVAASAATFTIPGGFNLDTSLTGNTPSGNVWLNFGDWHCTASAIQAAFASFVSGVVITSSTSSTTLGLTSRNAADASGDAFNSVENVNAFANSGATFSINFEIPIAEWAGNGTVNLGQGAQVEYASSTNGTWDAAAAATNTVYGPAGSPLSGSLTNNRDKVVRFQYPIQTGDIIQLQYNIGGLWVNAENSQTPFQQTANFATGAFFSTLTGNTDVTINFRQFAVPGTTYNSSTGAVNWSTALAGTAWRLVKSTASAPVGFGLATTTASGLYNPGQNPGVINASDAAVGNLGEYYRSYQSVTSVTRNIWVNLATITLPPGDWDVSGAVLATIGAGVTVSDMSGALSLFSGGTTTDHLVGDNELRQIGPTAVYNSSVTIPSWRVSSSLSNTVYLKVLIDTASGNPSSGGRISARRVR